MKIRSIKYFFLVFIFLPLLISCGNAHNNESVFVNGDDAPNQTSVEGVIIFDQISGKHLLIQDTNFQYEDKGLSIKELLNKYDNVLFLSFKNESLVEHVKSGQKVRIWYNEILESNPPIYKVEQLEISED
ncbi:DUF3221 domain-containing protein [Ureibacillus sp. Re31]|uniref:DUF3221 domain-containing protein n=1 Tax=Ureibacillus galli TaxID=2762222 RepID=A0ABR8XFM4_9BACL|nr:DUF3221 domain-containing protein [Ureibacillus galli]MBD8028034.1 DUF3221 domain-containing protein [Ureibacillus galli]